MSRKKIVYGAEFKAKVILKLLTGEKSLNELAREYEISPATLSKWHQQFQENLPQVFGEQNTQLRQENATLRSDLERSQQKIGQLTLERDWLEKKSDEVFGPNGPHRAYLDRK